MPSECRHNSIGQWQYPSKAASSGLHNELVPVPTHLPKNRKQNLQWEKKGEAHLKNISNASSRTTNLFPPKVDTCPTAFRPPLLWPRRLANSRACLIGSSVPCYSISFLIIARQACHNTASFVCTQNLLVRNIVGLCHPVSCHCFPSHACLIHMREQSKFGASTRGFERKSDFMFQAPLGPVLPLGRLLISRG